MINALERELPPPSERIRPYKEFEVAFKWFVGGRIGSEALSKAPDFVLKSGRINPAWVRQEQILNKRISNNSPGNIDLIREEWVMESDTDQDSPLALINKLKSRAQEALAQGLIQGDVRKERESVIRQRLVEVFNTFAGLRFNNVREIANGLDFRGINLGYLASRSLLAWRTDLIRARQQSVQPLLFERSGNQDQLPKGQVTPTMVDDFFLLLFQTNISSEDNTQILQSARTSLNEIFSRSIPESYKLLADIFYAGDMQKTYINLSAIARMTGKALPAGWQQFQGSTTEFRDQREWCRNNVDASLEKFLQEFKYTSLKKARSNFAAINNMRV